MLSGRTLHEPPTGRTLGQNAERMTGPVSVVGYAGLDPGKQPRAPCRPRAGDSNRRWQCPRTGLIRRIY